MTVDWQTASCPSTTCLSRHLRVPNAASMMCVITCNLVKSRAVGTLWRSSSCDAMTDQVWHTVNSVADRLLSGRATGRPSGPSPGRATDQSGVHVFPSEASNDRGTLSSYRRLSSGRNTFTSACSRKHWVVNGIMRQSVTAARNLL